VLQDPLDHSAPVRVGRQGEHLALKRFNDELETFRFYGLDALLNDVVAVLIFDTLDDASLQFSDYQLLLVKGDALQRQRLNFIAKLLYKLTFLFRRAVLEEILYDEVSKDICH